MTQKPSRKDQSKYKGFFDMRHSEAQPPGDAAPEALAEQDAGETLPKAEKRRGRPAGGKSTNPRYVQVSGYVPREVYAMTQIGLQKESIETGKKRDFSDLLEELLTAWNKTHS
ncbi:MAG: hypothetical protein M3380_15430 [Chloroflexota bacterium]|nr:hypothetical protein [Chloroflexota bacterium]